MELVKQQIAKFIIVMEYVKLVMITLLRIMKEFVLLKVRNLTVIPSILMDQNVLNVLLDLVGLLMETNSA